MIQNNKTWKRQMEPLLHPSMVGRRGVPVPLNPAQHRSQQCCATVAPEKAHLLLQCSPSRAQQAEMAQKCLCLKCFSSQHNIKNKNESMWRVINEQSWLIVRLLTWSDIMLSPKLFLQKIIRGVHMYKIITDADSAPSYSSTPPLMWKNRLTNSCVFCL